jgi:hypothetical protein
MNNRHIFIPSYLPTVLKSYSLTVLQSYSLTVILLIFFTLRAAGQGKNEEVTIIAPYIPTIGNAVKIPSRPEITPGEEENPTFGYNYVTKNYETKLELDPIEPLKYSTGENEQLYRNFAKIGFGNYVTPYLDFMASSVQSEKYQFGVRLKHLSSQGKIKEYPPSAYSHNLVSVFGRVFTKTHTLFADAGYDRDVVHLYGFRPDSFPDVEYTKDDIRQRFQHIHGTVDFSSNYRENYKLNHRFTLDLHHYSDFYETRESEVAFMIGLDKSFKTGSNDFSHSFALDFGLNYLGYKDSVSSSNPLFIPIHPVYRFAFGQYRFEAGLKIEMASVNTPGESSFGIDVFPVLKAEVVVVEGVVKAFAEVSGNRTINSFRSLTGVNPFMISTPVVLYTDEQIKVGGGITGNYNGLNFTADAYYSYLNDMPLFVTDTNLEFQNQFDVIYDNMNLLKIKASLGYVKINDLSARLLAAYYHYIPKNEVKAWHMPNFEIGLDAGYTLLEKYTIRASILALGSKYAKTYDQGQVVAQKIKGAFDLGAGFEYRINRMVSAYVDANNLLNQHYQRWYEYPVQGILVMAGAKISF